MSKYFICALLCLSNVVWAKVDDALLKQSQFQLSDVFELEQGVDPQISPDGKQVVYVRKFMDKMTDKVRSNLWVVNTDGSSHQALTTGEYNDYSPLFSPDGKRLVYVSNRGDSTQVYMRWLQTGQTAKLTQLPFSPSQLTWSPDGKWLAFVMFTPKKKESFASLPAKPKGAKWADEPKVISDTYYRYDGAGYLKQGHTQVYVISTEGGSARQLTFKPYPVSSGSSLAWSADNKKLFFAANYHDDWDYQPRELELYSVNLQNNQVAQLTKRFGPDANPQLSPNGKQLIYMGYDDKKKTYQHQRLYLYDIASGKSRAISEENFPHSIKQPQWRADGKAIYFLYAQDGLLKLASMDLNGQYKTLVEKVGSTVLGRPYLGAAYSVATNNNIALTLGSAQRPTDIAVYHDKQQRVVNVTQLNIDALGHKRLAEVTELKFKSSHDGKPLQGWLLKPSDFDPEKKYPLLLEIHGGPHADYGPYFSTEFQLYAAAGYVVFYMNPRGSITYGEDFANLIHHNYPGEDYDDLMSGVDAVINQGYIDDKQLFITGGSGGGTLSSWVIGKTDRFKAAAVVKPVINWYSFVLTADAYTYFTQYWFPGMPWDNVEHYYKRSPLSLVGNVKTPTMLMTGEADYRTPMSETEQYFQALKLRKVDTVLVRIPGASHNIAARPSQMMAKVAYILKWFEQYKDK